METQAITTELRGDVSSPAQAAILDALQERNEILQASSKPKEPRHEHYVDESRHDHYHDQR